MDVKQFAKDNWPYLLGGAVGILVVVKFMGGGSNSGGSDYAAYMNAMGAASQANVQAGLQQQQLQGQLALQDKQITLAAQNDFLLASAAMGAAAGTATKQVLGELNSTALVAMNAAVADNKTTVEGAVAAQSGAWAASSAALNSMVQAHASNSAAQVAAMSSLSSAIGTSAAGRAAEVSSIVGGSAAIGKTNAEASASKTQTFGNLAMGLIGAFSDPSLKENVAPATVDSLERFARLKFYSFDYIDPKFGNGFDVGLMADEVADIAPDWVIRDAETGKLMLLVPQMLMASIHATAQLAKRVAELEARE